MPDDISGGNPVSETQGQSAASAAPATFTQEQLNAKLAENKRNLQRQLEAASSKAQAFDKLQAQVSELLASGVIDGVEDLASFRTGVEETIRTTRTEAENLKLEQKKLAGELEKARKAEAEATTKWTTATIERAIADEAGPRAVSPGALELIRMKLAADSKVKPDGSVVILQKATGEDGKPFVREIPVKEAVEQMEADVKNYGSLFKATVNSGSGGSVDGIRRNSDGAIDFSNMSFEKFMELSKKAPDVLARSVAALTR